MVPPGYDSFRYGNRTEPWNTAGSAVSPHSPSPAGNQRQCPGDRQLHIHPQTVRYRLRQLDALFGDHLREPDDRFNLEVALRANKLLNSGTGPPPRN
jgi:PucR-like helix-turn-helix protein